jgi:hypothetical protein
MTSGTTILMIRSFVIIKSMLYIRCLVINQVVTSDVDEILGF